MRYLHVCIQCYQSALLTSVTYLELDTYHPHPDLFSSVLQDSQRAGLLSDSERWDTWLRRREAGIKVLSSWL